MRIYKPYVPKKDTYKKLKDRNSRLKRENKDIKINLKHKSKEVSILMQEMRSLVTENERLKKKLGLV